MLIKQYHVTLISIAQKVLLKQRTWRIANILVIESEEEDGYVETEDGEVPKQAYDLGMSSLVDVETFKDILSFQYKLNPKTLYKDCIKAIEYYLSNDDFLDE